MVQLYPNIQNGLNKESAADCFQVRSLSQERLKKKIGSIDENTLNNIKDGLKKVFSM